LVSAAYSQTCSSRSDGSIRCIIAWKRFSETAEAAHADWAAQANTDAHSNANANRLIRLSAGNDDTIHTEICPPAGKGRAEKTHISPSHSGSQFRTHQAANLGATMAAHKRCLSQH
jgi:hypothetical protein